MAVPAMAQDLTDLSALCRAGGLRARQEIRCAFWRERRAGRCEATRRRRCGDIVEERQRRRYAPWPPRPAGLRLQRPANDCGLPVMIQLGMGVAAKCQIILARALRLRWYGRRRWWWWWRGLRG